MKIIKYTEFIKEELNDTPENYISIVLTEIKRKIDKIFDYKVKEPSDILSPDELKKKDSKKMSLIDFGIELESSEISKYSKLYDSLTVKFSDTLYTYTLIVIIDIKEALPKDPEKDFETDDIKKCYIKFKKYDISTFDIIGQISKNIEIKDINEDFLIDLKLELDEKFGDEEEFKIETK